MCNPRYTKPELSASNFSHEESLSRTIIWPMQIITTLEYILKIVLMLERSVFVFAIASMFDSEIRRLKPSD